MSLCGEDHKKALDRLSRIEGQVRGISKMIEDDRDCFDVLKQIAATMGAMKSLGALVLEDHLRGCVSQAIRSREGGDALIDQVIDIFNKFAK